MPARIGSGLPRVAVWPLVLLAACEARTAPAPPSRVPPSPPELSAAAQVEAKPCGSAQVAAEPPAKPPDLMRLAAGLESSVAGMVQNERSDVTARPASFLARGKIWHVEYFDRWGHAHFTVTLGELEGVPTTVLSSSAAFLAFARRAGLALDDDARRAAYVKTFLSLDPLYVQLLESPKDFYFTVKRDVSQHKAILEIDPGAIKEIERDVEKRREVEDRHGPTIKPLCLTATGPFRGVIHAIKRQRTLVRLEVTLEANGAVAVREVVLVTEVPVGVEAP